MEKLSLRALGLLVLIKKAGGYAMRHDLVHLTSDNEFQIEKAIEELQKSNMVELGENNTISANIQDNSEQIDRIYRLCRYDRPHWVVGWFLDKLQKTYADDEKLKERVACEIKAAQTLQFWDEEDLEEGYETISARRGDNSFELQEILEYLNRKSRG